MKKYVPWIVFFLMCIGVGFLHGVLPYGISHKLFFVKPVLKITTIDETFIPPKVLEKISRNLQIQIQIKISYDWKKISTSSITDETDDILIIPSYWANSLAQQNILHNLEEPKMSLIDRVAPDFIHKIDLNEVFFLPIYWLNTQIHFPYKMGIREFFESKEQKNIYLINDEDHILNYLDIWEKMGLKDKFKNKIIIPIGINDSRFSNTTDQTIFEGPSNTKENSESKNIGSLFIWGATIPKSSKNRDIALAFLFELIKPETQEEIIQNSPIKTTVIGLSPAVRLDKTPSSVRNIKLHQTQLIQYKDPDAAAKIYQKYQLKL